MASIGSSLAIQNNSSLATKHKITHLPMATANFEYSHVLVSSLRAIEIVAVGKSNMQFSFTTSTSGTIYIPIPKDTGYHKENLNLSGETLYIQADKASETAIIVEWYV